MMQGTYSVKAYLLARVDTLTDWLTDWVICGRPTALFQLQLNDTEYYYNRSFKVQEHSPESHLVKLRKTTKHFAYMLPRV